MARVDTRSPMVCPPSKRQRALEPKAKEAVAASSCSSSTLCCGICLSSVGEKTIRGRIDSCDHCFCFMCIREWSKVESKCPLCKQRFSTIRRPAVEGVFDTERVVDVPLRDQVYDPLGIRRFDPYAEAKCSVCNGSEDECLLLLCDLCDMASHTYCVGSGFTVPMGDWICHECTILRDSQANGEESDEDQSALLLCIVRDSSSSRINCAVPRSPPPLIPSVSVSNGGEGPVPACDSKVPLFGARTRHRCRDVLIRIQALRENWDALRHGSVSFSSGPTGSVDKKNSQKQQERLPEEHDRLGKASSSGFQQSTYDVNKAWRMMNLAKSRRRGRDSMIKVQLAAKDHDMKGNASERGGSFYRNLSHTGNYCPAREQKQEHTAFKSTNSAKGGAAKSSSACSNSPYLRKISVTSGNGVRPSRDRGPGTTSQVGYAQDRCTHMISSGNSREGSSHAATSVKSEIQSLVKRILKLLTSGNQLGVDAFKEIARASTHNILAACGLQHSKSVRSYSITSPVCPHRKLQHESSPMQNCCRECFEAFVKNVVSSIMSEKKVDRVR